MNKNVLQPVGIGVVSAAVSILVYVLVRKRIQNIIWKYQNDYADAHLNFENRFYGQEEDGIELYGVR